MESEVDAVEGRGEKEAGARTVEVADVDLGDVRFRSAMGESKGQGEGVRDRAREGGREGA